MSCDERVGAWGEMGALRTKAMDTAVGVRGKFLMVSVMLKIMVAECAFCQICLCGKGFRD